LLPLQRPRKIYFMIVDLHVHTTVGSPDSGLTPEILVSEAKRLGLDGVCVTEHHAGWDRERTTALAREHGLIIFPALEVHTDLGHVAVLGLDGYLSGIYKAEELRRRVEERGGFIIALHPFRYYPVRAQPSLSEAAALPLVQLCDEIEVANGGCSGAENALAYRVACSLGKRGIGGSDAHSVAGLGCYTTVFQGRPASVAELIEELKGGRFYPAQGLLQGRLDRFRP